jgi:hypothetical protein
MKKIGIITGSGYGASHVYKQANIVGVALRDINLHGMLFDGFGNIDPEPYYTDVIKWFVSRGITHGSVACNTYCKLGLRLLSDHGIEPTNSINDILFNEVKKYKTAGWISTRRFKYSIPPWFDRTLKHISDDDQKKVERIIYNELAWNIISLESVQTLRNIVNSLECDNVFFACTDLSLVREHMDVHIIDSAQLHIQSFR